MKLRAALLLGLLATLPAYAGMFDDEVARQQIADLRQNVDTLTKRIDNTTQNQLDFSNQAEALRAEVARLTGQIEVLTHSLEAAHKRQQDFYVDLDNRLRKLESPTPDAAAAPTATATADPQAEMREYEAALGYFREGKFKEAQAAFEAFSARHSQSALLPNAHYWLGSSLYQQKQFAAAAKTFGHVAATWPTDAKAPDALLAQANAQVGAQEVKAAVRTLETLVEKYPTSPTVTTARARLKTLAPKKK